MKTLLWIVTPIALSGILLVSCEAGERGATPRREPNVMLDVSSALLNAAVQRNVDQTEPVRETIQDTPICGTGRTLATVHAELVPDGCRAVVDLVLQGSVYSRTVGTRQTILIHTYTTTPFEVRRRVVMDDRGIQLFHGPSHAKSTTQLLDVTSTMDMDWLAIRTVRRAFGNTSANAEAESAWKTAWRASNRFDDELTPILASASETMGSQVRAFQRAGLALDAMNFSSSATRLEGRFRFATPGRTPPIPVSLPPDFDLAVRIHESVATEAAQTEFGGRSFPLTGVSKIYDELTRGLILDGRKNADPAADLKKMEKVFADLAGKEVKINLAKKDPLIVKFADQGFSLEGRVMSVRIDKIDYAGLRVKAAYRFENTKQGVFAVRQGAVQFFPEKAQPGQKEAGLPQHYLILLETLFGEFMKQRLRLAPLPIPESLAGRLDPPRAYARNGWFALVWKMR